MSSIPNAKMKHAQVRNGVPTPPKKPKAAKSLATRAKAIGERAEELAEDAVEVVKARPKTVAAIGAAIVAGAAAIVGGPKAVRALKDDDAKPKPAPKKKPAANKK